MPMPRQGLRAKLSPLSSPYGLFDYNMAFRQLAVGGDAVHGETAYSITMEATE